MIRNSSRGIACKVVGSWGYSATGKALARRADTKPEVPEEIEKHSGGHLSERNTPAESKVVQIERNQEGIPPEH